MRGIDRTTENQRLARHDTDGPAVDTSETSDDVERGLTLELQEFAIVEEPQDDVVHVVTHVVGVRNERVELTVAVGEVRLKTRVDHRRLFLTRRRQVRRDSRAPTGTRRCSSGATWSMLPTIA